MSDPSSLDLFLLTYNINKQTINGDILITKIAESLPDELSSLYVFGLQEFCSILEGSFQDVAGRRMITLNGLFLQALSRKYGKRDVRFQTVAITHVGATGLLVITPYPSRFDRFKLAKSSCGYAYSSLKGAVGVRLTYVTSGRHQEKPVELTFANAHLPAYEGEIYYRRRNEKLTSIIRSLDFSDGYGLLKPGCHTFFMGDLNYRTTTNYKYESEASSSLFALQDQANDSPEDIESLVKKYDELSGGKASGDIFAGFSEGCITFPPTYKFHVNTAIYNSKRSPSWCDRILYQSTYENSDTKDMFLSRRKDSGKPKFPLVRSYNSINTLLQSDHHPVYLHITVPLRAPKSIVSSSGYLQLLPSEVPNRHFQHDLSESTVAIELSDLEESVSGPTQIYVKPTRLDFLIQTYVSPTSDFFIGYGLWLGTTPAGRLLLLVVILVAWCAYYLLQW